VDTTTKRGRCVLSADVEQKNKFFTKNGSMSFFVELVVFS